ncbi:hypothetical protein ZHAS_00002898 [Anopheles sinensis]|uniref:Uncharacterized protein n=1 Tax=Anopheles sinensis TaxID=74873 RepID=A0A084VD96_ANOSI|nr:hypothetical protein ZHAS_00002898 [Anopheles sinensis]
MRLGHHDTLASLNIAHIHQFFRLQFHFADIAMFENAFRVLELDVCSTTTFLFGQIRARLGNNQFGQPTSVG